MKGPRKLTPCNDTRECFARKTFFGETTCALLETSYSEDKKCPFCKPHREYTNGKHYPYRQDLLDHRLRKGDTVC